jgi:hypothetical protein
LSSREALKEGRQTFIETCSLTVLGTVLFTCLQQESTWENDSIDHGGGVLLSVAFVLRFHRTLSLDNSANKDSELLLSHLRIICFFSLPEGTG